MPVAVILLGFTYSFCSANSLSSSGKLLIRAKKLLNIGIDVITRSLKLIYLAVESVIVDLTCKCGSVFFSEYRHNLPPLS